MSSYAPNPGGRNIHSRPGIPRRPKTPHDYTIEPFHKLAPANVHEQLMSEHQKGEAALVHQMPLGRFKGSGHLAPPQSPSIAVPSHRSTTSFRSLAKATSKGVSKGLVRGRAVLESAVDKGKQVVTPAARSEDNHTKKGVNPSPSSSKPSRRSLYFEKHLPRLIIPDATKAATAALNSACSTATTRSASWTIEGLSPTSRELRHLAVACDDADVSAEMRNMITARRRVRKAPFGREVGEHCRARPGWDETAPLQTHDWAADMGHLRAIVRALQKQKDLAQDMAKRDPGKYPGLRVVRRPRCTDKVYWQPRSY
ncbi:hypothetical protein F4810DRAFT_542526 [Camillea tinctor]|nr:hypothetical protein F4810DRAFT_542526 [Camillea tinctor]